MVHHWLFTPWFSKNVKIQVSVGFYIQVYLDIFDSLNQFIINAGDLAKTKSRKQRLDEFQLEQVLDCFKHSMTQLLILVGRQFSNSLF
jgi:hypothetical protein